MAPLLVILLLTSACLAEEFEDRSHKGFNHIAVDSETGKVYIGAVDALYRLDADLRKRQEVDTTGSGGDNVNKSFGGKLGTWSVGDLWNPARWTM